MSTVWTIEHDDGGGEIALVSAFETFDKALHYAQNSPLDPAESFIIQSFTDGVESSTCFTVNELGEVAEIPSR